MLDQVAGYEDYLRGEECSEETIRNYLRDVRAFALWLDGRSLTRELAAAWKEEQLRQGYQAVTVNSKIAALNGFFRYLGRDDCRMRFLKVQRRMFRSEERNLTREEYVRLVQTAQRQGKKRLSLLLESICATGIRVSEVPYLTVEAAKAGKTDVHLKGKIRTILLPGKLCKRLLRYAKEKKIASGEIFLTRSGRSLSRKQIWAEMKALCRQAGVAESKVFPHNLRHLFAVTFYKACRDIARLADMLGHSSIETTRIYLLTTGREQALLLDHLRLVC